MRLYADVILPLPLDQPYTYSLPAEMEGKAVLGTRVLVPLGERWLTGIVVGLRKRKPKQDLKVKPIAEVLEATPLFTPKLLDFARKLSRSFLVPWGEMLQASIPPSFFVRSRASVVLTPKGKEALEKDLLSDDEGRLAVLLGRRPYSPLFLERKSQVENISAVLARMQRKELVSVEKTVRRVRRRVLPETPGGPAQLELDFSADERVWKAAETISGALERRSYSPFLLFGSDGRRKAVYSRLLRKAVSKSGRILFIVPEISLVPALIEDFEKSLGEGLALLHSGLTDRQRELEWQKVRSGRVQVVIGTRSALFSPLENLRLIILDEEQDDSYSQQEGLPFDVRMAAKFRAEEEEAVFVLGSAAPTIESFHWARRGRYLVDLGREEFQPKVTLLDVRGRQVLLDSRLLRAIRKRLDADEQAILFFNRRGYASYLVCSRCRFVPNCDRCDVPLAYHRSEGKLVCHACRRAVPAETDCPRCRGRLTVKRSAGIEAVAEDLRRTFPGKRVEIFAADETGRKEKRESLLREFERGGIDVLVGTQFLAHQGGLPPVSLVGVLHPEMVLHLADFRSGQKAYQLISRASLFLSRDKDAEILIQTAAPEHHSIRLGARGDFLAFFEREVKFRRLLDYPPFSSLAEIVFSGANVRQVAAAARTFVSKVKDADGNVQVFGPSLAPLSRKRGLFRVQVSLKARNAESLKRILALCLKGVRSKKSVNLFGG